MFALLPPFFFLLCGLLLIIVRYITIKMNNNIKIFFGNKCLDKIRYVPVEKDDLIVASFIQQWLLERK